MPVMDHISIVLIRAAEYGEHCSQEISAENELARKSKCKNGYVREFEKRIQEIEKISVNRNIELS